MKGDYSDIGKGQLSRLRAHVTTPCRERQDPEALETLIPRCLLARGMQCGQIDDVEVDHSRNGREEFHK